MKIFALEGNYNDAPTIFVKPDSALLKDRKPFFIPDFSDDIAFGAGFVLRVSRLGRSISERFAHRYYDAVSLGLDITARDLKEHLAAERRMMDTAKGFDGSFPVGSFMDLPEGEMNFRLEIDGNEVQRGRSSDMRYGFDRIISQMSRFYTLKMGDMIFTGTPGIDIPAVMDTHVRGFVNDVELLDFKIK